MNKNLLQSVTFFCFLLSTILVPAQNFTWMKGPSSVDQPGIYGQKGVAATGNNPGGRSLSCTWKDAAGNFWMFGGGGFDYIGNSGLLNDLWKYSSTNNQWTWVSGDNIFLQLGKYGTMGVPSTTNCPGARNGAASWMDGAGNLWLFGGYGYGSGPTMGHLNDLWKYNIANNEWTWISGSDVPSAVAVYGGIGVPAPGNHPGAREGAVVWTDQTASIYLFGGNGVTTNSNTVGQLNDIWIYDMTLNEWTWVNGSNVQNQNGSYGVMGTPSSANTPGGRNNPFRWTDNSGTFWLFGGYGFDGSTVATGGALNDLWKYNKAANQWTWVKGSNLLGQGGTYGTMGIPSSSNIPGGRTGGGSWIDGVGNVWLFGGAGHGAAGGPGQLNDLWRYNISTNEFTWIKGATGTGLSGVYGTMSLPAQSNSPGSRSTPAHWIDASNNLWFFGGNGYGTTSSPGKLSDMWTFKNCHINPVVLSITSSDSLICKGEPALLSASGSNNYTWNTGTFSTSILITPSVTTSYTVYSSDGSGCVYNTTYTQTVHPCTEINEETSAAGIVVFPNPGQGQLSISGIKTPGRIILQNTAGQVVFESQIIAGDKITTGLPNGLYFYSIRSDETANYKGKLVVSGQ